AVLEGIPIVDYSEGYLETIAVYRKIADYVSHKHAAVFHGALIELHGEGYLFTAKSGTGKTTHIRNWMKQYPEVQIVNGDKPILKVDGQKIRAYGTPWCGKEGYQSNQSVPLKAVIILERSVENHIQKMEPRQVLAELLGQTYRPADGLGMYRAMELVGDLCERVALYRLGCNMEQESAVVAYEGMQEEQ
ncbi:MAG: hypothetical protein Q4B72_14470, partial [Lachnospiraceae bacterium]|nr:hypothetical protein [Lachnospiraceae bacterium]